MNQSKDQIEAVRPRTLGQGCAYVVALAIVGLLSFIDAVPYHINFYAWCLWHFTGGQVILGFKLWRLCLEQQAIRRGNPYYRKSLDR
jgi:hypothetical protein